MVDKNLMGIDQVVDVNDSDMLYVVQNETTDGRVSVGQVLGSGVKSLNTKKGDVEIVAGANVSVDNSQEGKIVINSELSVVRTPEPIYPLDGQVDVSVTATLQASAYANLYGVSRQYRQFQVDDIGGDFSSPIAEAQVESDSWAITPQLTDLTEFKWRCRDVDIDSNISAWSSEQSFTTYDIYIQTPSILTPTEGGDFAERDQAFVSSAFVGVNTDETHVASYWQIKNSGGSIIHSTGRTTTSLTSYVPPLGVLAAGNSYTVEVRYEGSESTISEWSVGRGFVAIAAPYGKYLAVGHTTSPYVTFYGQDVDTFIKLQNPTSLPTGEVRGVQFDETSTYACVAYSTSPYVRFYKRQNDAIASLSQPTILPGNVGQGCAISADGVYAAVGTDGTPSIVLYKRTGDIFAKLADPATLPASTAIGLGFSNSGTYLAVGAATSGNKLVVYKRSGDTFTSVFTDTTIAGQVRDVMFDSTETYLVVGHDTSPFVTIYKRDADTFTKVTVTGTIAACYGVCASPGCDYVVTTHFASPYIRIFKRTGDSFALIANPGTVPPGFAKKPSFDASGTYLSIAHTSSPFVSIYKRSGDTFTKLANPANLPKGDGQVAWLSPSATYA